MREFCSGGRASLGTRGASTATKQTAGSGGVTGSAVIIPRPLGHAVLRRGRLSFFFPFFFSSSSKLDPVSTLTCVRSICVPKRHTPLECLHGAHNLIRLIMDAAAEGGGRVRCVRSGGCYLLLFSFFSPLFFSCNFLKDIFFFLLVVCIP